MLYIFIFIKDFLDINYFEHFSNPFTLRIHSALSFPKKLSGNRLPQYVIDYSESG